MQEFISFLAHDPRYKELSQEFTAAHNDLMSYLGERVDLLIKCEEKERLLTNYIKGKSLEKISDVIKVI
jgi:hypothetical protein